MNYILKGHTPKPEPDITAWAEWFECNANRIVAQTDVGRAHVSTVFLGLGMGGRPILFETMVFGGPLDQEQESYCTWEQAEAGHADMVARCEVAEGA